MRVLIVCRYKQNLDGGIAPFVKEQMKALAEAGVDCSLFQTRKNGLSGYFKELPNLKKSIKEFSPDVIHAHFGLSGLLANLQRKVPVVTTYHGSDINVPSVRRLSRISICLSAHNVFVSQRLANVIKHKKRYSVIPCGINIDEFPVVPKEAARESLGLRAEKKYILFAGAFDNGVKNPSLAKEAASMLKDVELLELKGYSRPQVALLLNAVDCVLMTSVSEGSPQVIKEAMACGCPIVSVDVGDVSEITDGAESCYIAERNAGDISAKLQHAIASGRRTNGRQRLIESGITNNNIAQKIISIYQSIV